MTDAAAVAVAVGSFPNTIVPSHYLCTLVLYSLESSDSSLVIITLFILRELFSLLFLSFVADLSNHNH